MKKTWRGSMLLRMPGEIQLLLQHRPGGVVEGHLQFFGDDGGKRGLAQPRRPVEQHVVHGFAALRAASMAMARFSFSLVWPVKSARRRGRSPASNCASSASDAAETIRLSAMYVQLTATVRASAGKAARTRPPTPAALALRTAVSAGGRAEPRFSSADRTSSSTAESAAGLARAFAALRRQGRASCRAVPAPCARRSSCRRRGCAPAGRPPRADGRIRSGAADPERIFIASVGPMPLTPMSFSNSSFSSG